MVILMTKEIKAEKLFEMALDWLKLNYGDFEFFAERDLVWTIQNKVRALIIAENLSFEVYNDFPIIKAKRRSLTTDLVILNKRNEVEVAVEFKYEPDHQRGMGVNKSIWPTKLSPSVVFWGKEGVAKDVERVKRYIDQRKAKMAITIFIDEGRLFRHRHPHLGTRWVDWNCGGRIPRKISLLIGIFKTKQVTQY